MKAVVLYILTLTVSQFFVNHVVIVKFWKNQDYTEAFDYAVVTHSGKYDFSSVSSLSLSETHENDFS